MICQECQGGCCPSVRFMSEEAEAIGEPDKFRTEYTEIWSKIRLGIRNGQEVEFCIFLGEDYSCTIYDKRPQCCRDYICLL